MEEKRIEDMTREELIAVLKNERQDHKGYKALVQMYAEETKVYKERIEALRTIIKTM